jgi:hypothetical protein
VSNNRSKSILARIGLGVAGALALAGAGAGGGAGIANAADDGPPYWHDGGKDGDGKPVSIEILTPVYGDNVGVGGLGWIVNLAIDFPGGPDGLERAGFTAPQLTGPAGHDNIPPFPGTFGPGQDDRLPGLVVLVTTNVAGAGQNVANLFNLTGVTNRSEHVTQITDDWIVGAENFGSNVESEVLTAVVKDLDGNGIFDDAPDEVPDANGDGKIDEHDLESIGLASEVEKVKFRINGNA